MNQSNVKSFIEQYKYFQSTDAYKEREKQKPITPIFREIIWETLKHEKLTNQHLTDLIQIFKWNCTDKTFDVKLNSIVEDKNIRTKIREKRYEIAQPGYTNAGKTGISGLTTKQLATIRKFLLSSFEVKTKEEAIELCKQFEKNEIPLVKKGIYSPWLFYINPSIFPIINNEHKYFKNLLTLSNDYADSIGEYHALNDLINENNFGGLDYFAHHLSKEGKLNLRRIHYLNGSRLFKISHGVFFKNNSFSEAGILKLLELNNWISLSRYTGKDAGKAFEHDLKIGDIVYLCYGGDKIVSIARVISEAKPFSREHALLLGDDKEEWIYREIEPLYFPIDSDISDLKNLRSQTMPSGNSTFWEIKSNALEYLNENLFIPKFNLEIWENEESDVDEDIKEISNKNSDMSLNMILYGPPGTGKTFNSISYAVAIVEQKDPSIVIEESNNNRDAVKARFDKYLDEGLIVFTTFHQNMSYEDFIEGIKPLAPEKDQDLKYDIVDGIFKNLCNDAESNWFSHNKKDLSSVTFEDVFDELKEQWEADKEMKFRMKTQGKEFTILGFTNKSIHFKKASGGEGHTLSINTLRDIYYKKRESWDKGVGIYYPGIIEKLEIIASKSKASSISLKKYVIIIDEINRGNVSQIFGELITLIEDDKRIGATEALKITLPYSKDQFGVPPNLYIIGTMNTADRSVEALDTALRRRFSFVPKLPDEKKLGTTNEGINLSKLLYTLNSRLKVLKDNDHTIGHAWLWDVPNINKLQNVFEHKILPLLQEYFYHDYEKLGLVLGDAFFKPHIQVSSNILASFSGGNGLASQYDQSWYYQLKTASELTIADFKTLEIQINNSLDNAVK